MTWRSLVTLTRAVLMGWWGQSPDWGGQKRDEGWNGSKSWKDDKRILFQGCCCKRHKEMEQWFHLLCTATHTEELNLIIDNLSTFLYQNTDKTEVDTCIHWEKRKFYFNIARQVLTFNGGNTCKSLLQSKFSFFCCPTFAVLEIMTTKVFTDTKFMFLWQLLCKVRVYVIIYFHLISK